MSETAVPDAPREEPLEAVPESSSSATSKAQVGTPAWVWLVYALGIASATVFAGSLVFVALAYATEGKNGDAGLHVAVLPLVVWLAFALAALGTFVRRRSGGRR